MSDGSPPDNGFVLQCAGSSHRGAVRPENEDSFLSLPELGIWAVADGVGGATEGSAASRLVTDLLASIGGAATPADRLAAIREKLAQAQHVLEPRSSATTVVVLLVADGHHACVWAGDSRIYLLRDGRLKRLTRDHSQVQDMLDAGLLTEAEAETHPQGNVITRAVGAPQDLALDVTGGAAMPDDTFLLCSDGLSKIVAEAEIARILAGDDVAAIPVALVDAALTRGAPDNVTAVVVRIAPAARG